MNYVKVCIGVGLSIAAVYALIYITTQISMDTADRRGQAAESDRVYADGDRRVALREEFYDLCSTIQSQNTQIDNQRELLDMTTDEQERQKLMAGILGMQNTKAENVEQYNAMAADGTRGFLRDEGLPARINVDDEDVECASGEES